MGLGFRVWGSGFRVGGEGFTGRKLRRVQEAAHRGERAPYPTKVEGAALSLESGVWGFGFRVSGLGVEGFGFRVWVVGLKGVGG